VIHDWVTATTDIPEFHQQLIDIVDSCATPS